MTMFSGGLVKKRTTVSCSVCCLHFSRDCDLLEVEESDGTLVWTCESNTAAYEVDCGFSVPAETPIEEIRRLQFARIEVLKERVAQASA